MLLIFTNTYDLSANRIIERIGSDRVFRFNFDIWHEYKIELDAAGFTISNPTGHSIGRTDIAKAYWRKPISRFHLQGHRKPAAKVGLARLFRRMLGGERYPPKMSAQQRYLEAEMDYLTSEIRNLLWKDGKLVLVEPSSQSRLGKLVQLDIARHYFLVPPYSFFHDPDLAMRPARARVAKSLSSERLGLNAFFWTTAVDEAALNPRHPWFVQDRIDAGRDVTVVHVRGRNFAFGLDRNLFVARTVDWREAGDLTTPLWAPQEVPAPLLGQTNAFMREVGLDFGRLDFLQDGEIYWFLEVNSNGEWGWLDPQGKRGVLDALVSELDPDTPVHPIPLYPFDFADRDGNGGKMTG